MRIEELSKIDFNDHWLAYTRRGELKAIPRDPVWLRWIKSLFQVLTFCFYDVFGHVRISRVAQGLFQKFKKDFEEDPKSSTFYIGVINKLLTVSEKPIRTHREELLRVKAKISEFQKEQKFGKGPLNS